MTHELQLMLQWLRIIIIVAAVATTLVPIVYSFSPWYTTQLGRMFMVRGITFALAMDLTALFAMWNPNNIVLEFWTQIVVFSIVAITNLAMAGLIWRMRYFRRKAKRDAIER